MLCVDGSTTPPCYLSHFACALDSVLISLKSKYFFAYRNLVYFVNSARCTEATVSGFSPRQPRVIQLPILQAFFSFSLIKKSSSAFIAIWAARALPRISNLVSIFITSLFSSHPVAVVRPSFLFLASGLNLDGGMLLRGDWY